MSDLADPSDCPMDGLHALPPHWSTKQIKFACSWNDEVLSETTSPEYEFDYVDISSVSLEQGITHRERMTFEKAPSRARRVVRQGDCIVSTVRTYLKAIATVDQKDKDLVVSTGFAVLRPGPDIHNRYLGYFVQSHEFVDAVVANSVGVSYPAINASELVKIPILFPPLGEQQSVAAFLDRETARIDTLIKKKRRLLELLEEKRLVVITEAVTRGLDPTVPMKDSGIHWLSQIPAHWESKRLKYISPRITVGIVVTPASYYVDEGIPALRGLNIKEREIDLGDIRYISAEANQLHAKSKIFEGDLVSVRTGQPGTTVVVPAELDSANCIDLIIVRKPLKHDPTFLSYFANSYPAKAQYLSGSEGALQQHFNIDTAKNLVVTCPPLAEQREILACLEQQEERLLNLIDRLRLTHAKLGEYRSALITNAVTGKIDVRGYVAEEAAA